MPKRRCFPPIGEEPAPQKPHNAVEEGYIALGNPYEPQLEEGFTAPNSRFAGGDTDYYACDVPMARTRKNG
jgi:hypothetical protein